MQKRLWRQASALVEHGGKHEDRKSRRPPPASLALQRIATDPERIHVGQSGTWVYLEASEAISTTGTASHTVNNPPQHDLRRIRWHPASLAPSNFGVAEDAPPKHRNMKMGE